MNKVIAVFTAMGTLLLAGCMNVVVQCPCQQHEQHQPHPGSPAPAAMMRPGNGPTWSYPHDFHSVTPAAPGSVEHKLREQGKSWERTKGKIMPGSYVEDIYKPRMNQPAGRGDIGQVVSVSKTDSGEPAATVDFGRDYIVGIKQSELAPLKIIEHGKKHARE